eukprot:GHVR01082114.1.p1 GENE.GHVR01082114.1~~GHVR01082114.1.p1  ORF type:complete len:114 (-),score=0.05 GHVR01082114.1:224-565(-)
MELDKLNKFNSLKLINESIIDRGKEKINNAEQLKNVKSLSKANDHCTSGHYSIKRSHQNSHYNSHNNSHYTDYHNKSSHPNKNSHKSNFHHKSITTSKWNKDIKTTQHKEGLC